MAIRTFSAQESFREGGIESRKKLKKVRSVKVANLDRLRSSMRREKSRFNRGIVASSDDASVISGSSSAALSGTSSPNYMKATSSSARKGSVQAISDNLQSSSASKIDIRTSSTNSPSKLSTVSEQEFSGPADVNKIKAGKSMKRVPSLKQSKKLSSKKSMKIRAKYSQFSDVGINSDEMLDFGILGFQENTNIIDGGMEIDPECLSVSASHGKDCIGKTRIIKQKGILERSSSRKMIRLKSIRSSRTRQRPQSRFSGGATELMSYEAKVSNAEPHYMKGTSSQEKRKNSAKGLTRTSSLRPLRILAKIPSLRPKRNKGRKRPQVTPLSGKGVDRATCSSTLKRTEVPDEIELHSRGQESEGASSLHLCPYSYCSIHGHRHHTPTQPLTEFISAKRKLFSNQKCEKSDSQSKGEVEHYTSSTESDQSRESRQIVSAESYALQEVMNATAKNALEADEDGIDFLIKIYAKPRKKWAIEGTLSKDAKELNGSTYDQISIGDYDGKQAETLSETSDSEEMQRTLNDDRQETYEIFKVCNVDTNDITLQQTLELPDNGPKSVSVNEELESSIAEEELQNYSNNPFHFASRESAISPGDDLINILSDKRKYTSMWQLIHQQLLSSEASMNEAQEAIQADEEESGDGNTSHKMINLDLEQSNYSNNLKEDIDDQIAVTQKLELHQTAAIKLVQEAVNAILQHDAESYNQQSNPVQEMANSSAIEEISTPTALIKESYREDGEIDGNEMNLGSAEKQNKMKQVGNRLLQKESDEKGMSGRQMSKSFSRLKKLFMTAKFIKAMERLKKINPSKPQYLSAESASENERIYLRHLSMNKTKNTEEWMLDNALRKVISRLGPDQQRRVARLVEAFETVNPEQKENTNRPYPVTSVPAPGCKVANLVIEEEKIKFVEPEQGTTVSHGQFVQKKDDGVLLSQKDVSEEKCSREDIEYQANTTGEKILQESIEINSADANSVYSTLSSNFVDGDVSTEDPIDKPKVSSKSPTGDSEVSLGGDMTSIFLNKQQYTGMWNLIYQHAVSNEASVDEKQRFNELDEENQGDTISCRQMNDRESISSSFSMDQKDDEDNQSATSEKPEVDQSAAIKLVKEALSAILKRYEQPPQIQSIPDLHMAADDTRDLYISTSTPCTQEDSIERVKNAEKQAYTELEDKMHPVENTSLPTQQQVESDELKAPPRKISKSLSKLKKAIATTRFIKAMERLTKNSPRRSHNLCSDTISEEERVYLRHRSMDGRKKGEEWMLDYALRQVISKMDPDQQRRVALIVKAFETVHPEQREKSIRCNPRKGEAVGNDVLATTTNEVKECYLESQQKRLKSIEQIPLTQDNRNLLPCREAFRERSLQEHHAQQPSLADDIFLQETNEAAISKTTLKLSEDSSRLSSMVVTPEEPYIQDEETWRAFERSSPSATGNSEIRPDGDMANILLNKQKYTSMWNLIHQHVLSNQATTTRKLEANDEGDDANTCQAINDPDSNKSNQLEKSKVDEDNHSAAFDESAAINLVKEAINAILQCHEQKSNQPSCEEHGKAADSAKELCETTALDSTKNNPEGKRVEKHIISEPEKKLHEDNEVESASTSLQQQVELNEASKDQRKMSKSLSKLKKAIVTAKFIKAMERLRKINPRKPQLLPPEVASEEERVYLRHLSINGRKNDEEWMLDYALRKVLSNLAPDQQRKVALLVEAFETVHPEQKGIRYWMKSDLDSATGSESIADQKRILKSKLLSPMPNKDATLEKGVQDHSMKFSNLMTEELSRITFDSDDSNSHSHCQASLKGSPISDDQLDISTEREMDVNPMHGEFQHANDYKQENKAYKFEGNLSDNQKNSGMWHLIYQHVKSAGASEPGSKLSERQTEEDQVSKSGASSDTDADVDDSDASSTTSELTESDAIKLVKEAINDILDAPHIAKDELTSSNRVTASESQSIEEEENSKKSLSRGYSKLRKIIICNKFIKAMEKTGKFYPQTGRALNRGSEARNAHLKNCGVGDRKGMDEWMLDNVLQKVIAGLAPVQQKRVSMLVKAFEKVNPDPEERGKGLISSKRNTKEMEEAVPSDASQSLELPGGFDLKLDRSQTSSREVVTERVLQESRKDRSPGLTKEYALSRESCSTGDPCDNNSATFGAIRTLSGTCKDPTEFEATDAPSVPLDDSTSFKDEAGAQVEEKIWIDEQEMENTEIASKLAKKPPQLEDLEDEWNYSTQNSRSFEKPTGLWGLILQHVSVDMLEKNEAQKTIDIETNVQVGSSSTEVSERKTNDSSQLSSRVKSCRDMGVQTPTSFEFEENEAIKLVEEAVEEILLLQDQICDAESVTSSTTSEKGVDSQNNEIFSDPSHTATETAGVATSLHTIATLEEKKAPSKETVPSSYSTLSKVVMCRKFIKGMKKMRKLKALDAQGLSQSQGEGGPSLRQISTRGKAGWEEGMLDNALQKVIGNLAPAKKQRVALLVQAFETVGSQPDQ